MEVQVLQDRKAQQVHRGIKGLQEEMARKGHQDLKDHRDHRDLQALRECRTTNRENSMSSIPWINEAQLKADADKFLPVISKIAGWIPGLSGDTLVNVLQAVVDDDNIRIPVVNLINTITGAQKPAAVPAVEV